MSIPPSHAATTDGIGQPLALQGIRILSLALNLPGPAALMRLRDLGAQCIKVQSPAGDPMRNYSAPAYDQLHADVRVLCIDLKTTTGQAQLHTELSQAQVLLTSFRPSALHRLALDWPSVHSAHPHLSMVAIVGSPGERAEEPGHDLTYLAEHGLVNGTDLPATLYADMAGALLATQAVLQAVLVQRTQGITSYHEVALSQAAAYLALPRAWGLTQPSGVVGGAHAGYCVYACADGHVAVAALEPHFAAALCQVALGLPGNLNAMQQPETRLALATFFSQHSCQFITALAQQHDIPLHCTPFGLS